jgi:hypothetical protein
MTLLTLPAATGAARRTYDLPQESGRSAYPALFAAKLVREAHTRIARAEDAAPVPGSVPPLIARSTRRRRRIERQERRERAEEVRAMRFIVAMIAVIIAVTAYATLQFAEMSRTLDYGMGSTPEAAAMAELAGEGFAKPDGTGTHTDHDTTTLEVAIHDQQDR